VEKLCTLINEGKRTEAKKYFSAKLHAYFDNGLFEQLSRIVTRNGKMKGVQARAERVEGNKGTVLVALKVEGEERPLLFCPKMVFEDEKWRVEDFRLREKRVEARAVLVDPRGHLIVGTSAGVFRSTDSGTSWSQMNTGLTNTDVRSLAVSGTNLFAGTFEGVFLWTKNSTSWTAASTGLPSAYPSNIVRALTVSGTNLFAGTPDGVFLSTNSGSSWTAVGLTKKDVLSLAVSGSNLFAGTHSDGVFLSTNSGASWTAVNTGLPTDASDLALAVSGTNLFAGTHSHGVFLSTNDGVSWIAVNNGLPKSSYQQMYEPVRYQAVRSFAVSGTILFAGPEGGGVFRSTDNGTSWTLAGKGLPEIGNEWWLTADAQGYIYAGSFPWLFRSKDNGSNWSALTYEGEFGVLVMFSEPL